MPQKPDRAEIYERHKGRLNHIASSAGTRGVTSPKIILTPGQRGVANYYGACMERREAGTPLGGELREAVDGGPYGSHIPAIGAMEAQHCLDVSWRVLREAAPLVYAPRSSMLVGPHHPIPIRHLVDAVCVYGADIGSVAKRAGWWVEKTLTKTRSDKSKYEVTVQTLPKQQSQKVKAALVDALDAMGEAWIAEEVHIPRWVGTIEVG